jgi:hypothetical protein
MKEEMIQHKHQDSCSSTKRGELQKYTEYLEQEIEFERQEHEDQRLTKTENLESRKIIRKMANTIAGLEDRLGNDSVEAKLSRGEVQQLRDLFWSVQQKLDTYTYQCYQNKYQIEELREQICDLKIKFYGSRTRTEAHVFSNMSAALQAQDIAMKTYIQTQLASHEQQLRDEIESHFRSHLAEHRHSSEHPTERQTERRSEEQMSLAEELQRVRSPSIAVTVDDEEHTLSRSQSTVRRSRSQPQNYGDIAAVHQQSGSQDVNRNTSTQPQPIVKLQRQPSTLPRPGSRRNECYDHSNEYTRSANSPSHITERASSVKASGSRDKVDTSGRLHVSSRPLPPSSSPAITPHTDRNHGTDDLYRAMGNQGPLMRNVWKCRAPGALNHGTQCVPSWRN